MRRRVIVEVVGDALLIRFNEKRLSGPDVRGIGEQFTRLKRPHLNLDMAGVTHLTSDALGGLVALHKQARAAGGQLRLTNVGPTLYNLLDRTRLTKLFEISRAQTEDEPPA